MNKPAGFTSFDVVAKMRGIARTKKIGHAGTLDPMATGVLPLFFGRAAKACDLLPCADKSYDARLRLGIVTDTLDITGEILETHPVTVSASAVCAAAAAFSGPILQIPPMYSAIKINGQKLCDLARKGIEVERAPRPVTIHSLVCEPVDEQAGEYRLLVDCSKGTYIRTLAQDIGQTLGCGATLTALCRTMAAGFSLADCVTFETVEQAAANGELEQLLLPVEQAFQSLPQIKLGMTQARMLRNGVRLDPARISGNLPEGRVAIWREDGMFLGVGETTEKGFCAVKLFHLD